MAETSVENGQETVKPVEEKSNNVVVEEVKETVPPTEKECAEESSPELLKQIKNQVEFYFGDVNMQRDKFLIEQTKLDEGWIPMTIMLNFKMLASLSKDADLILKGLVDSELIEISEDKKKIRRSPKHPLPVYDEEYRKAQEARTVYVKGFPQSDTTVMKLKAFLEPHEPIENIIMRRYRDNKDQSLFKGSVFVQFKTLDAAKAFIEIESIKYGETELIRKWSKDYAEEKAKEKEELREKRSKKKSNETKETKKVKPAEEKEEEKSNQFPKGSIIHVSGLSAECIREDIKQEFTNLNACVAFVEYSKGNPEGWVRLQGKDSAAPIFEKMENGKITISGAEVICRILEGEEEQAYLDKVEKEIHNLRQQRNSKDKHGGKKGRGKKRNYSSQRDGSNKKTRH